MADTPIKEDEVTIKRNIEFNDRNVSKYGPKDDDVIARTYRENKHDGDMWCRLNIERYVRRFTSNSHKAENLTDLRKALDYLARMIEINEQLGNDNTEEVIEK